MKKILNLFKKIRNKGFWLVFVTYILFAIADITTTLMNSELIQVLELNPLYTLFNSVIPIILINIVFVPLFWFFYTYIKATPASRYFIMQVMMTTIAIRLFAIRNAINWYIAPAEQKNITILQQAYTPEVIHTAQIQYAILVYLPLLFCLATFLLWYWDHNVTRKDQKKLKKKN